MCTKNQLSQILDEVAIKTKSVFGEKLQSVILYGSYARGDFDEESDIDVIALVNLQKEELAKYRRNLSDFSSALDLRYNVVLSLKLQDVESFNKYANSNLFYKNVLKEGIAYVQ